MPSILDPPPPGVAAELAALRAKLDQDIPAKLLDRNLLLATWNIRWFGDIIEQWIVDPPQGRKRDLHAARCLTDIISRFDIVAVQEVQGNAGALRAVVQGLGAHWGLILTDINRGRLGNFERLAFLFDTRKVTLAGLACELVIPQEDLDQATGDAPQQRQFARSPYAATFRTGDKTFTLVSMHALFWGTGGGTAERIQELQAIAAWLDEWRHSRHAWDRHLIALGDFQIDHLGSPVHQAFTATGLRMPDGLQSVPRTIFDDPDSPTKMYSQIAWFDGDGDAPSLPIRYLRGGSFDFTGVALQSRGLSKRELSYLISDHFPLWAEFSLRG
jgi:endonuclease/exonuclease/phosphatase family metal-dependent hydrolase